MTSWRLTTFPFLSLFMFEFNPLWVSSLFWSSWCWPSAVTEGINAGIICWPVHERRSWPQKFMWKSQKNRLNSLQFFIIFGWNFPHWHIMKISKFSSLIWTDYSLMNKVTFVADHKFWNFSFVRDSIVIILLQPCCKGSKRTFPCDVIHKDYSTHISIVMHNHTFAEPFLASSIPDLQLYKVKIK